jgi:hypothetical protein
MRRHLLRTAIALLAAALLTLTPPAVRAFDDDDDLAKIWKELVEKIKKATEHATKAKQKYAEKEAKRLKEDEEDKTEAQQQARTKARKEAKESAHRTAAAAKDTSALDEQALDEMEDRVDDYVKDVHKKALKQVGPLPDQATPEQIVTHQRAMADAIRAMRAGAKQGDLIVPEAQPIVKRLIAEQLAGPSNAPARKEALAGNPPVDPDHDDRMQVPLSVNGRYPDAAALSTVPPGVVLTLPILKKEVEYHFVGRDLVLLDVEANLILDYLRNAAPQLAATPAAKPTAATKKRTNR